MVGVDVLLALVFSGLAPLVVEDAADEGALIRVAARTPDGPATCPRCGVLTGRVHSYHLRTLTDVPLDARRVLLAVRVRRLVCRTRGCLQTFREQVAGVLERYQRRTVRLTALVGAVVRELAGRAGVRVLSAWSVRISRHAALRCLLRLRCPPWRSRGCWASTTSRYAAATATPRS